MGCGNCGSGASGKPGGCKGNGGCSTGGCNRFNVFNWLADLPLSDSAKPYPVIEVSFNKGSRKEFYRNSTNVILEKGEWIAVEGTGGFDVGQVSLTGELVKLQLKKYGVKEADVSRRVLHPATEEELETAGKQKDREAELLTRSRAIARNLKLEMKLCEVEVQADGKKGTFFYTADQRVDFRELIKLYAGDFKMKIEMRQIGARQESGKVGGIGSCGRELCCSTWLTDFKSVNTTAARYQNLSINQTKLSGQCGRLKCCLNYELDTYMDALSVFPDNADSLETVAGVAHLQKKDIFKNLMWYSYSNNNKQYPLSITRVREIQQMNKQGKKADELHPVEIETRDTKTGTAKVVDMGFVNDVGQITLKALEKNKKKKKPAAAGTGKPQQGQPQQAQAGGGQQKPQPPQGGGNNPQQKQQSNKGKQQARPAGEQQQRQPNANKGQQPAQGGDNQQKPREQRPPRQPQQQKENKPREQRPPRPQGEQKPQGEGQQPRQGQERRPQNNRQGQPKGEGQQGSGEPQPRQERRPQQPRPPREQGGPQQAPPPPPAEA